MPKSLSEMHREAVHKKGQIVEQMRELLAKQDGEEGGDEGGGSQFDALQTMLATLDARITQIESAMAAEAAIATEEPGEADGEGNMDVNMRRQFHTLPRAAARPKRDPNKGLKDTRGIQAARFAIGVVWSRLNHQSWDKAAEFVDNRFGDDDVTRFVKALNGTVTGEGGALIPQDFLADLIELLRANTVVRGAGPMEVGMPMGNITIPRLAGGATAAYQNELDDIAVSQERFDDVNMVAKKLTAMVPISNDLIRRAPIGVEEIVRDDLAQTIARREDLAFLRGDGTDKGPAGMKSLCLAANRITVTAMPAVPAPGDQVTAILAGASAAILALQNGMSRMIRPTWFMAPTVARFISVARDNVGGFYFKDEMAAGMFEGYPVKLSQQIPTNLAISTYTKGSEIYFCDMADFIIADTYNVIVDSSDVAAYNDGTGMISTFQRDQSLFRVIAEHDVNMRHLQSLAVLLTQDWAFAAVPGAPGAPYSTQPLNPTWSQAGAIRPALATGANAPPTLTDPH
ncbi:MAG TPA: phage major capsid protein [Vicinamibacterales bacterium]|nr:phage major capsid protein [Vicinamibacterales bacterium]